jgi:cytochrome P450 family 135
MTGMDVSRTSATEADGAAAQPAGCPVDHTTAAVPADGEAPARPAIPATELPRVPMHPLKQIRNYWQRPYGFMEECRDRYGRRFVLSIRIPVVPLYVICDPDDLKQVFLAPADVLHTGNGSATIEKYTGTSGLAWLDEDEHKVRRRYLMPTMHGRALQRIGATVEEQVAKQVASWPQDQLTPMHPYTHRLTLEVIRGVIFGDSVPSCWDELAGLLTQLMSFNDKIVSPLRLHEMPPKLVRALIAFRPSGLHRFLKLRDQVDALLAGAVAERRASGERGDDMLSVLLDITHEDGSALSVRELRDEMMTIFLAGTETTATALAYTFEFLSRETAVRERLVAEIDAGESEEYLTAVIQEVLRVRAPLPQIILREVMKPIEIGGVRYEPGMILWPSAHLLHHDPVLYPEPHAFRPERWLGTKPTAYTWAPFGGGRIRCLGADVALVEMKAVIRGVLTRYDLHRDDPVQEGVRSRIVTTQPAQGGRLELRARTPEPSLARD